MFSNDADLARLCDVSPRTVRRWRASGDWPPVARLAAAQLSGDLGTLFPAWRGWMVHGDTLTAPDGRTVSQAQILQLDWFMRLVDHMQDIETRRRSAPVPLSDHQAASLACAISALTDLAPILTQARDALSPLLDPVSAPCSGRPPLASGSHR